MEDLIIYGAGRLGRSFCSIVKDKYNVIAMLDKNETINHSWHDGIEIIYPWEKVNVFDACIVVCVIQDTFMSIKMYLESLGYKKICWYGDIIAKFYEKSIINIWKLPSSYEMPYIKWYDEQSYVSFLCAIEWFRNREENTLSKNLKIVEKDKCYYTEILENTLSKDDVIVDCCCLDGHYLEMYQKKGFKKAYGFIHNPNILSISELEAKFKNCDVVFENLELSNKKGKEKLVRYSVMPPYNTEEEFLVNNITADEYFYNIPYSYIRVYSMSPAWGILQGAANTIRKYRPIIAVNIGYYCLDFVQVPLFLKTLNNYKLFFRLHEFQGGACVIYAIPEERI